MRLIAVDPGTRLCGWALFGNDNPVLAGVVKSKCRTVADRAVDMGEDIVATVGHVDIVVVERPVIYPNSRERDADIVDLAVTAGIVGALLGCVALIMPTPREWKGSVPKDVHNERTKAKCPAAVELVERDVPKGQRNHVWDAVGLALWYLEGKGSR